MKKRIRVNLHGLPPKPTPEQIANTPDGEPMLDLFFGKRQKRELRPDLQAILFGNWTYEYFKNSARPPVKGRRKKWKKSGRKPDGNV